MDRASDHPFPDAPMIARLRRNEEQRWGARLVATTNPFVDPVLRRRLDAIVANHPIPEEET